MVLLVIGFLVLQRMAFLIISLKVVLRAILTHHMRLLTLVLVLLSFEIILGVFLKEYPF